jgi:hypothetical protein
MAGSVSSALCMIKYTIFGMCSSQFTDGVIFTLGMKVADFVVVAVGCVIVFAVSLLKEKGVNIRESIAAKPLPVRWLIYYACFVLILVVGYSGNTSGFIYANF